MNPITQFENSAREVWRSELTATEKQKRLSDIRTAIEHYLERIEARRKAAGIDPWTARAFDRVRQYLKHLAADVEELALQCERPAASLR